MAPRLLFALLIATIAAESASGESAPRPNIVLIVADDLGYSDLGCYGGEIATPNLDRFATGGVRFTQFYNTARCWPTRAALLTGYYAQQVRRDSVPGVPSGGRGIRPAWATLVTEALRSVGYRSYHSGKWHIDGKPTENGFDRSYLLQDQGRFFSPQVHFEDDTKLPPVQRGSGFYATRAIADHALRCLKEHAEQAEGVPFFHYIAFTAPHFPLHALPEDIDRYRDVYRVGWDEVRAKRWQRLQEMGLVGGMLSPVEPEIGPPYDFPDDIEAFGPGEINRPLPWRELSDEQREFQAMKMAVHAAMVDRMDREIGRIFGQLRSMKVWNNTLILFLSDNGASAEIMIRADGHDPTAEPGSADTHLCLGPGWSTVCNTPFRRHKTWVHEGGIATPLIAHWPDGMTNRPLSDGEGEISHQVGHVIDLVPTFLELANAKTPKSDPMIPPRPGMSFARVLTDREPLPARTLWWLHEGNRAIRVGDWKLVASRDDGAWELFDLGNDRTETRDLATTHLDKVRRLEEQWKSLREAFYADARADLPTSE